MTVKVECLGYIPRYILELELSPHIWDVAIIIK
jgi:hypothetical protein